MRPLMYQFQRILFSMVIGKIACNNEFIEAKQYFS